MSIYQEILLDHYKNPHNFGVVRDHTHAATVPNPMCGDTITMHVIITKDTDAKVESVKFSGEGCAVSTAAASLLTDHVKGKSIHELKKLDKSFMLDLLGIDLSPNRLKCALLPLETLQKAVQQGRT